VKSRLTLLLLFPMIAAGAALALVRYLLCVFRVPAKGMRIAVEIDEAVNVAANGRSDETVSLRAAKAQVAGRRWGCVLCRLMDVVAPGHCADQLKGE